MPVFGGFCIGRKKVMIMADSDIKNKVVKGLFWKLLENGGAQGVQFVIAILLARLLTPAEYGVVGIIMIFITIANVVVQNGFSTALVQKRNADSTDFSSVCYFSLAVALFMYVLLYAAAPSIASFYRNDSLRVIVRVLSAVLFPGAVISVQTAYVSRNMEFKGLFLSTLLAALVSGVISIFMAYRGFGVWAVVGQQVLYYFVLMAVLLVTVSWKPKACFAMERVKGMFQFGWKLLCASLLDTVFNNLYGLLIGKIYNEELLGSYNRGEQFPKLIATNLGAAIQAVLLPAFSAKQDEIALVRQMMRRAIQLSSFAVLPMLFGLFAVGDNLVLALLGERWLVCVPFLRIMCISYCFWPIHITNLQAINAVGRSDIFLKLEVAKKLLSILALIIGVQYSVTVMVGLKAFQDFLSTFINAAPNKKLLNYSILHQWMDVMPSMLLSVVMCASVWYVGRLLTGMNVWLLLFIQILFGGLVYGLLAWLFRMESFRYLWRMVKQRKR